MGKQSDKCTTMKKRITVVTAAKQQQWVRCQDNNRKTKSPGERTTLMKEHQLTTPMTRTSK